MKKLALTILVLALAACTAIGRASQEPPPGWRVLASDLLLADGAFPEGWTRMRDWPEGSLTDSTINHVYRSWWWEARGDGSADQAVWRAYTIDDAKDRYGKLRKGQYLERLTPRPYEFFVPFEPPIEIEFQSEVADSFYIACGWYEWAYCEVIARYGNYVTELTLDLEAEIDGHQTPGLTYGDISRLLQAMDKTFSEFLAGAGHGAGEE